MILYRILEEMDNIDLERFSYYNDAYEFVDELYEENSTYPIRLTGDKYCGTIIRYDKVHIKELYEDENEVSLKFDYEFIENPHQIIDNDPVFSNYIGDILVNIIINTLNEREDADRDNNSKQPDTQRGLQQKSSTVS